MRKQDFVLMIDFDSVVYENLDPDVEALERIEQLIDYIEQDLYENASTYNSFNLHLQDGFDIISLSDTLENIQAIKEYLEKQGSSYFRRLKIENNNNL